MRILMINARNDTNVSHSRKGMYVPLGILSVATYAEAELADRVAIDVVDEDVEEDDEFTRRHQRKLRRSHLDYVTGGYSQGGYVASTIREYRNFISRYVANPNYTTASTSNLGSRLR